MEVFTEDAEATKKFGREFADKLSGPVLAHASSDAKAVVNKSARQGVVLALSGDLGSGKTTFVQGLAEGLGIKERILSPTFVLVREYDTKIKRLYHIDLYRLEGNVEEEFGSLGIEEIWGKKGNIVAIEWAEKVKGVLPEGAIWIKFEHGKGDERRISIK